MKSGFVLKRFYFILLAILFFNIQTVKGQDQERVRSVLLLIDVSGSMIGPKIDSVKSATKKIIHMLLPCQTEFSVMGFSGKPDNPISFRLDFTRNEARLDSFINALVPWGATPLGAALKSASLYFTAHQNPHSIQQNIILLSDGRADDNINAAIKELKAQKSIIQCECIGFDIVKDKVAQDQLAQIANETDGEYYVATNVKNVIKAFLKSSIKTIMHSVPVEVRQHYGEIIFPTVADDPFTMMSRQNWVVDSIQINVSEKLYDITSLLAEENMQDTMPTSLVFENDKKISLFIRKGTDANAHKKWIEGNYVFSHRTLTIHISHYTLRLVVKTIDKHTMVLCVNKYKNSDDFSGDISEEVCDCNDKMNETNPYIFIYFSQAGCL
jgi:uncharacterized protein YegL